MKSGIGSAALMGAVLALVLVLAAAVGSFAWIRAQESTAPISRMVVIATVPGSQGGEVAGLAFVVDAEDGTVEVLDSLQEATVAGTSARNARDAYSFGGGASSAQALAPQTGGEALPWIVLPAEAWTGLIDDEGGVQVEVPDSVSAYSDGSLTVFEAGPRLLSGADAVALVSSSGFFSKADEKTLLDVLSRSLANALTSGRRPLRDLVTTGAAESSLPAEKIPELKPAP